MSWIFSGDLAADTVSCLQLLVCVLVLLHLFSLLGNQTGSETAFMLLLLGSFLAVSVSQPDELCDYPNKHAITRERALQRWQRAARTAKAVLQHHG